jgi:hypothetical protein
MIHIMKPFSIHEHDLKNKVANLVINRNQARILALASNADKFLFVDSDVSIPLNCISKLDSRNVDIVGGFYPFIDGSGWIAGKLDESELVMIRPDGRGIVEVDMVGIGCALFDRACLEKIIFTDGLDEAVRQKGTENISLLGECLSTICRAKQKGFRAYMDSEVICEHLIRR